MIRAAIVLVLGAFCAFSAGSPTTMAVSTDVNLLKYFYVPTANQKIEIAFDNKNSLDASQLKSGAKTIIIVDGFTSDSTSPMSTLTSETYSRTSSNNVIIVDWAKLSGNGINFGNPLVTLNTYVAACKNVPPVGQRIAQFINFLRVHKNIQFSDVTIIGHSLGSHIAAAAGRYIKSNFNGQLLARIVGVDPAGIQLGQGVPKAQRLAKDAAAFVDVYHSNRGTLGDSDHDTGHVNVYINGGKNQPGCEEADTSGFAGYCSHSFSWKFFNSVTVSKVGCPCNGDSACTCTTCNYQCSNGVTVGPSMSTSARGRIHITVAPIP